MPKVLQNEVDEGRLGRDISRRIACRERALLQMRFLEDFYKQPISQFFTLTGASALRGVYLKQPWGGEIELTAPPALASRFNIIADAFGDSIERMGDRIIYRGETRTASDTQIVVGVISPSSVPHQARHASFFGPGGRNASVRAAPINELITPLLERLVREPQAADILDIWLYCRENPHTYKVAIDKAKSHNNLADFSTDLTVEQIRSLRRTWKEELKDVSFALPKLVTVYKNLRSWLPPTAKTIEAAL
jgi:hypothetical protein